MPYTVMLWHLLQDILINGGMFCTPLISDLLEDHPTLRGMWYTATHSIVS